MIFLNFSQLLQSVFYSKYIYKKNILLKIKLLFFISLLNFSNINPKKIKN